MALDEIGAEDEFSQIRMDALDGFLPSKEHCIIVLPAVYKIVTTNSNSKHGENFDKKVMISKANVLSVKYEV